MAGSAEMLATYIEWVVGPVHVGNAGGNLDSKSLVVSPRKQRVSAWIAVGIHVYNIDRMLTCIHPSDFLPLLFHHTSLLPCVNAFAQCTLHDDFHAILVTYLYDRCFPNINRRVIYFTNIYVSENWDNSPYWISFSSEKNSKSFESLFLMMWNKSQKGCKPLHHQKKSAVTRNKAYQDLLLLVSCT